MWSNKKYNEKREADLKKWRIGEYAGSSLNKREPEIMEGAKSKRRRQYMIVEEDWGMGENPQKTVHEEGLREAPVLRSTGSPRQPLYWMIREQH